MRRKPLCGGVGVGGAGRDGTRPGKTAINGQIRAERAQKQRDLRRKLNVVPEGTDYLVKAISQRHIE